MDLVQLLSKKNLFGYLFLLIKLTVSTLRTFKKIEFYAYVCRCKLLGHLSEKSKIHLEAEGYYTDATSINWIRFHWSLCVKAET